MKKLVLYTASFCLYLISFHLIITQVFDAISLVIEYGTPLVFVQLITVFTVLVLSIGFWDVLCTEFYVELMKPMVVDLYYYLYCKQNILYNYKVKEINEGVSIHLHKRLRIVSVYNTYIEFSEGFMMVVYNDDTPVPLFDTNSIDKHFKLEKGELCVSISESNELFLNDIQVSTQMITNTNCDMEIVFWKDDTMIHSMDMFKSL